MVDSVARFFIPSFFVLGIYTTSTHAQARASPRYSHTQSLDAVEDSDLKPRLYAQFEPWCKFTPGYKFAPGSKFAFPYVAFICQ